MSDEDAFRDVPEDILFALYDRLDYRDQLRLMAVDKRFRRIARSHRFFWQDLRLGTNLGRDPAFAAVGLFLTRLRISGNRPVNVAVTIRDPGGVMTNIADHLSHIRSLALRVDIEHGQAVLNLLQRLAPLLKSLSLQFIPHSGRRHGATPVQSLLPMDKNIFASHAPRLKSLTLLNVALPSPIPSVLLARLEFLDIGSDFETLRLPFILRDGGPIRCLALRRKVALAAREYGDPRAWKHVKELCVDGCKQADAYPFAAWRSIPFLQLDFPDRTSTAAVLDHLPLHLCVSFRRDGDDSFVADLCAAADGADPSASLRRRVRGGAPDSTEIRYCEALQDLRLAANRIVRLDIPATDWDALLGGMHPLRLPELARLVLLFPSPDHAPALRWASLRVSCQKLGLLVLRGRRDVLVDATDVASFAEHLLCHASFPIALEIEHLTMTDSYALWHGVFNPPVH